MPKSKPTQVVVHRIELQEKERELAEMLVATKSLENVSKSVQGIGIGVGLTVVGYFGIKVWEKVMSNDAESSSLWDLASDPLKLKQKYAEDGFWSTLWDITTGPVVSPKNVWDYVTGD